QEEGVHGERGHLGERRLRCRRAADHVDAAGGGEALADLAERARLVVDGVDAEPCRHRESANGARGGTGMVTRAPPGSRAARSSAEAPKRAASRARSVSIPWPGSAADGSNPGPLSQTESARRSPVGQASTRISAPSGRAAATCFTLFWTSVWRENG